MKQCFYLVAYTIVGDDLTPCKIFLQEDQAVKYGRRLATQRLECNVYLYKQEITTPGTLQYVKQLIPFNHD